MFSVKYVYIYIEITKECMRPLLPTPGSRIIHVSVVFRALINVHCMVADT